MEKRILAILLTVFLLAGLLPATALAATEVDSGTCGDNLTWVLDSDGTLTISGTGAMSDWTSASETPWYSSISSIKSVVIKSGVTSIGSDAFWNCSDLTSITIPDSVTSIGSSAFFGCSSLTSVTIPDGVTEISNSLFRSCSHLTNVTIPDSVTSIGTYAFRSCKMLSAVSIPNSVTSIGEGAFEYCESLTSIVIPDSMTSLSGYVFQDSGLTQIQIPTSVTEIANYAFFSFADNSDLTDVYYLGTEEEWAKVTIGETGNDPLKAATMHYGEKMTPPHEHAYESVITQEHPCVSGFITYTCTICGKTYTEDAPVADHTWGTVTVSDKDGKTYEKRICTVCGATEETEHTNHDWVRVVITPATCTDAGLAKLTCSICGAETTEEIDALGGEHIWDDGVVTTEATCGKAGVKTYTCTRCETTKTEVIPATGEHTWNEGEVTTEPTCAEEGVRTLTCTVCGATETETIAKTDDHEWDDGEITTPPTCTESGVKTLTCTVCKTATKTETVDALGHDLTYTAEGAVITEACTRCDHMATATVTAKNAAYTGEAIETANVVTSEAWLGDAPAVTYENNVNAGTAAASVTVAGATAHVEFTIEKATEYKITLGDLIQYSNNIKGVTATVTPKDDTAVIVVEYGTEVAEVPCDHVHTEECGENGENCTHVCGDGTCSHADATTTWSTTAPTDVGTYIVRAYLKSSENLVVNTDKEPEYTTGTLTILQYVYDDPDPTPVPAVPTVPTVPTEPAESTETEPVNAAEIYTDIEGTDWYLEAVNYVVENGLMTGYNETAFAPNDGLSRAMLMTIIARIAGVDTEGGETWYEKGLAWAVENGISDGSNPEADITREQLVTMLYRYVGSPAVSGTLDFADADEISEYAVPAMTWAVQNGIIIGTDVGTLDPQANATRAEAATILMRFCEKFAK